MTARWIMAAVMALAFAGCWSVEPQREIDGKMVPVEGWAKLVSVDQVLATGVMEVDGRPVTFWWRNRVQVPAKGLGAMDSPEMTEVHVPLNVRPGEVFYYRGFLMQGEVMVTAARARGGR